MTTTDSQGHFSLQLPANRARNLHTLVLHRAGYHSKTMRIPVAEATSLVRAELHDEVTEAVVVGYQREQRQMVSGAVSSVVVAAEPTNPALPPVGRRGGSFFRWLTKPFRHEQKLAD